LGLGVEICGLGFELATYGLRPELDISGLELGCFVGYLNENTLIFKVFLNFNLIERSES